MPAPGLARPKPLNHPPSLAVLSHFALPLPLRPFSFALPRTHLASSFTRPALWQRCTTGPRPSADGHHHRTRCSDGTPLEGERGSSHHTPIPRARCSVSGCERGPKVRFLALTSACGAKAVQIHLPSHGCDGSVAPSGHCTYSTPLLDALYTHKPGIYNLRPC